MFNYGSGQGDFGQEKITNTSRDTFGNIRLGTRMMLPDSRVYRFGFSQGACPAGQLCMQSIGVANHDMDLVVPTAVAIGARSFDVTLGATSSPVDEYEDGYVYVNDGAGEGIVYAIVAPLLAVASAGAFTCRLQGGESVVEALTTASLCGLMKNPYKDIEVNDVDDLDGVPIGVPSIDVADNAYGWWQTWGPAAVLSGATVPVLGQAVIGAGTDGALAVHTATGSALFNVGVSMLIAPVDTDYGMTFLTISP